MNQKHNRWIHFRQILLCVAETQAIFLLFHMFLWCSFTSNVWSHGINERNQNNSGAKVLRKLIFLWRSKKQLSVTSSYIQKWIPPGLKYKWIRITSWILPGPRGRVVSIKKVVGRHENLFYCKYSLEWWKLARMNTVTIFCNTQGSHLLISGKYSRIKPFRVQTNRINIYMVTVVAPYFKFWQ